MIHPCKLLALKPEWYNLHVKPRHKWEDNIKISPKEIGYECIVWIWRRTDSCGELLWLLKETGNIRIGSATVSFWRSTQCRLLKFRISLSKLCGKWSYEGELHAKVKSVQNGDPASFSCRHSKSSAGTVCCRSGSTLKNDRAVPNLSAIN